MKKQSLAFLAPVLALLPFACGGSSGGGNNIVGGPACSVGACGGDIAGTWNVSDVCIDKSILMMTLTQGLMDSCPGVSLGNIDAGPSGTFVFNTDSTYSIDLTMTISIGMNFPASCFPAGTTCADLDAAFMQQATGDPNIQSASCAGSNPCVCTITEVPMQIVEQGAYLVSGSQVTQTPTGQAAFVNSYCAKNNTLTYRDAMPDPTNPVTAIVATKAPAP